ncbi:HAMP domain-containing protein [Oscillospiraceae bacterium CM]|nr:HAMP domain-containing protein [Oscillospiraceae bacterium CM]
MNETKKASEPAARVGTSIAKKLKARLFWRLVGIFLAVDLFVCLIAAASLVVYSEERAGEGAALLSASIPSEADLATLSRLSDIIIAPVTQQVQGFFLPKPLKHFVPAATQDGTRRVELGAGESVTDRLSGLRYTIYVNTGGTPYQISVMLGSFCRLFELALVALSVFQLLSLLTRTAGDRRFIRRTLEPITALTRAAQDLNAVSKKLDPEKMAALAGKLEGINAARLDTRIQVDETQEELKSLARAINSMLDRINEAYSAQVRFVSDASHELRTPISVIQGYANLLDRWGKNDEKTLQESISAIKEEAANMKDLVEQLLFLARGDNNTILLQTETFDLGALVEEVSGEMRMIDPAHTYEVLSAHTVVSADRALVKQALRILVDNAVKYTDAGGKITLSAAQDAGFAAMTVSDEGIGISADNIPHIFDRFYRADASRARATGGAGLGLAIAKWIAARHDGHLTVLSREGIGTRMTLALPLSAAALPERV